MRDFILLAALVGVAPLIIRAPMVGLLTWLWVTLMNPQQEVYGFLNAFGLNLYVALLTIFAWALSNERKVITANPVSVGLVLFALWTTLTTITAFEPSRAYPIWNLTVKSIFLALMVATLVNNRARLQATLWVLIVSIGYYGVKGGGFVLLTGGRSHVFGAADSMISDNNDLGLVLLVYLPLMNYLRRTSRLALTRFVCLTTMVLTVVAVIGTYSRGALVTLGAIAATYALRARHGVVVLLVGLGLAAALPKVLPEAWLQRMATIQAYNQDSSFEGRVAAWKTNFHIATKRPLTGGGFYASNVDWVAQKFSLGELGGGKAAHSIYFEVLGDHGFVGLALYLLVIAGAWINTSLVLGLVRQRPGLAWAGELARMLQVSLVAFLVGGALLSMAYYDGVLVVLALTAALYDAVRRPAADEAIARPSAERRTAGQSGGAAAGIRSRRSPSSAAAGETTTATGVGATCQPSATVTHLPAASRAGPPRH